MMDLADTIVALSGSFGTGFWVAWALKDRTKPVTREDMQRYMHNVVSVEHMEESYNQRRKMLHDANRRTMPRTDGGPPARVSKLRVRRRVKYPTLGDSTKNS